MKWFFSLTETLKNGESSVGDHRHFSEFRRVKNDSIRRQSSDFSLEKLYRDWMRSLYFCSTPGATAWSSRAELALNQAKVEKRYFSSLKRAWLVLISKMVKINIFFCHFL
jgi:NADH pyrophosphatase NudC (nudix superfamily)